MSWDLFINTHSKRLVGFDTFGEFPETDFALIRSTGKSSSMQQGTREFPQTNF